MKDVLLSRTKVVFYQFNIGQVKADKETFYHNIHFIETIQNEKILISNKQTPRCRILILTFLLA